VVALAPLMVIPGMLIPGIPAIECAGAAARNHALD
jgi:hypothetical protein